METDSTLIAEVRANARERDRICGRSVTAQLDRINGLVEYYEIACALSRGPDIERRRHWTAKAAVAKRRLSNTMIEADLCAGRT